MADRRATYSKHKGYLVGAQPLSAIGFEEVQDAVASGNFAGTPTQLPAVDSVGRSASVTRRFTLSLVSHVPRTSTAERELHSGPSPASKNTPWSIGFHCMFVPPLGIEPSPW